MDVGEARRVFMEGADEERDRLCDALCLGDGAAHEALLVLATDSEAVVRRYAVWALGRAEIRTPAVDAALVRALADEHPEVRAIAVDGVRSSHVEAPGVPQTLVSLMDDDEIGETRAFLALEGMDGAEIALPRAIVALQERRPSAYAAMRVLLTLNAAGTELTQAVRAGLGHSNPTVQNLARQWLERAP